VSETLLSKRPRLARASRTNGDQAGEPT
jgi:hypothetical protein